MTSLTDVEKKSSLIIYEHGLESGAYQWCKFLELSPLEKPEKKVHTKT